MTKKEAEFKQVYEASKDKIYRLCLGFMGNKNDANDLFQEVLIKIWNNLDGFRNESNINTWIYRITTNTALLSIHKANKTGHKHIAVIPENIKAESFEKNELFKQESINKLYIAIASLKEIDRIIISLLLEENSYKTIAEITGISTTNVGARINRIKKALAKKL